MRRRIVALSVGMTFLVVLSFAVPIALLVRQNIESKHLDEARFQADNVAYFISSQDPDGDHVAAYLDGSRDRYAGTTWVVLADSTVVGQPPDGVSTTVNDGSDDDGDADDRPGGVSAADIVRRDDGAVTRVRAYGRAGPADVYVYLTDEQLNSGQAGPLLLLGGMSLLLLALSFGAAEAVSRRLTRPLEQTAAAAEGLASGDLAARAPESGPPEVAQVGIALNRLADRVDEVIAVEREAVADLSHRLRTPLTALRLDVDALDDPETSELLSEHVDVLERTLTQIIFTARRPQREGRAPHSDATEVVSERAAFWSALAEDQDRAVTVSLPTEPLIVRAATEDLAAAVDALIENVIAHTPEGSGLEISVHAVDSSHVSVAISDDGPGIPPALWTRGRSDRGSSGIGLDIVRRCAEASGGSMTITNRAPAGSTVEMLLRRA